MVRIDFHQRLDFYEALMLRDALKFHQGNGESVDTNALREAISMLDSQIFSMLEGEKKDLALRGTVIGRDGAFIYLEHPQHGDEAPLMEINMRLGTFTETSEFWELPDDAEVA